MSLLLAAQFAVSATWAACRQADEAVICGAGRDSVWILPGTTSPDGKFAFGWQEKDEAGAILGVDGLD